MVGVHGNLLEVFNSVVDVTSANGLLLKAEQMPAISGLGLPMVLNLSTRDVSAPLNIKNGHSDLYATLGWGWLTFLAPTVQAAYDMLTLGKADYSAESATAALEAAYRREENDEFVKATTVCPGEACTSKRSSSAVSTSEAVSMVGGSCAAVTVSRSGVYR